jgi:hypothetical protein
MQALTNKEMEYISDSMTNEELLLKQCAAAVFVITNPAVRSQIAEELMTHEQHLHTLMNVLQQSQSAAPQQNSGTQQWGAQQQWGGTHQH